MRTLKDYRPQHDEDCEAHICSCGHRHTMADPGCQAPFQATYPCTCGLIALLAAPDPLRDLAQAKEKVLSLALYARGDRNFIVALDELIEVAISSVDRRERVIAPQLDTEDKEDHGAALLPADPIASPVSTEALPTISKDRLRVLVAAALKSFRDAHGDSIAGGEFSSAVKRIAGALYTEFNGYGNETTTQSLKQKSAGEDRSQSTEATTERLATDGTKELLGQAIIGKHICAKCSNLAVWNYMPGEPDDYYCDDCVSRGCSCNYDPETNIEDVDQHGRKLPCCEYDHSLSGFDVADPPVDRVIAPGEQEQEKKPMRAPTTRVRSVR